MRSSAQQKQLDLQKGLFLIRYESTGDPGQPPKVSFAEDQSGLVEFVLPPGFDEPVLWSPGASLIARISAPARVHVEVSPRSPGGSVAARLQCTLLQTDPQGLAWSDDMLPVDFSELRLLGHLAGRGDIVVGLGEWLGGPMAPTRIEGISVDWPNRPTNFSLRQSVRVGGQNEAKNTDFVEVGAYSGTRGRALPIVGVILEVSGPASQGYEITAEGLFLGSPQMRVTGSRVVLSGPSGREPLVGLRLQIANPQSLPQPTQLQKLDLQRVEPAAGERSSRGRVRVFRSRAIKGQVARSTP